MAGQTQFALEGGSSDRGAMQTVVLAAVTLAMALVGLVAAAGFVVVAQRRQRQLGLLAAIGAPDGRVRLVMVANGALVGLVASLIGGAVGIGVWLLVAPMVEAAAHHRIGRFDLPWAVVVGCLVLAIVTATAAAWWPARMVARIPVVAALSGRPTAPRPVHRSLALRLHAGARRRHRHRPGQARATPGSTRSCSSGACSRS